MVFVAQWITGVQVSALPPGEAIVSQESYFTSLDSILPICILFKMIGRVTH